MLLSVPDMKIFVLQLCSSIVLNIALIVDLEAISSNFSTLGLVLKENSLIDE